MSDDRTGLILSADHVAALAVTAVLCIALPAMVRRAPPRWATLACRALAVFLAGWLVADQVYRVARGTYSIDTNLPLELTNAVTLVAAVALWTRNQLAFELTWFWGLTGSLQATLTPGLRADETFPGFYYWHYFAVHSGVVVAAPVLAFGLRMTARAGSVWRVFAITVAWTAVVGAANLVTGGNYMYLREKPATASLLDPFGPWPWYLLGAAAIALAMFFVLDLPFRRRRVRAAAD